MSTTEPVPETPEGTETPRKRSNPWIWVCGVLAVVALGMAVWAISSRSDLDSTQKELATTQDELNTTQQELATAQQTPEPTSVPTPAATPTPTPTAAPEEDDKDRDRTGIGFTLVTAKALYDEF